MSLALNSRQKFKITIPRAIQFLIVAIFFATGVDWVPRYVAALSPQPTSFVGTLQKYAQPCNRVPNGEMYCAESYRIPKILWKSENLDLTFIGIGILLPATVITCENKSSLSTHYGNLKSDSQAQELFQTYQTAELNSMHCDGDLVIDVLVSKAKFARFGYLGGPVVIGSARTITSIKKAVEFFTSELYLIIAAGMLLSVMIIKIFLENEKYESLTCPEFEEFATSWTLFAFFSSNIPEVFFPSFSNSLIIVRLVFLFSSVAHLGPILRAISLCDKIKIRFRNFINLTIEPIFVAPGSFSITPIHVVAFLVVCSPIFRMLLPITGFVIIPLYLLIGIYNKNKYFICFSVCVGIECGKLMNLRYMPYGSMPLIFVFCMTLQNLLNRVSFFILSQRNKLLINDRRTALAEVSSQLAHDIKSPINALQYMLSKSTLYFDENIRKDAQLAIDQIRNVADNILEKNIKPLNCNDLELEIESLDSALLWEDRRAFELMTTILRPMISLKQNFYSERKDVKILIDIQPIVENCTASVDALRLEYIISNLIDNSVESINEFVLVNVAIFKMSEHVVISISDNGKGISSANLSKVVERGGTFGKKGGHGLGLSHAKSTIEGWGGDLKVFSQEGSGTTVSIRLPIPAWIVCALEIRDGATLVIIMDNLSTYDLLSRKFGRIKNNISIVHIKTELDFLSWFRENADLKNIFYLCSDEPKNSQKTGLELLEMAEVCMNSIIISTNWNDAAFQNRYKKSGLKVLPNNLISSLPVSLIS